MYKYVGSQNILKLLERSSQRVCVHEKDDILRWIKETQLPLSRDKTVVATFIIDLDQQLWINDRYSEHVLCAAGQDVLSAGEITFAIHNQEIEVTEITNQSTGYCPEPESWQIVALVLDKLDIPHPPEFTTAYLFRRCDNCGTTNLIKDEWFICGVCQSPLSEKWNFADR